MKCKILLFSMLLTGCVLADDTPEKLGAVENTEDIAKTEPPSKGEESSKESPPTEEKLSAVETKDPTADKKEVEVDHKEEKESVDKKEVSADSKEAEYKKEVTDSEDKKTALPAGEETSNSNTGKLAEVLNVEPKTTNDITPASSKEEKADEENKEKSIKDSKLLDTAYSNLPNEDKAPALNPEETEKVKKIETSDKEIKTMTIKGQESKLLDGANPVEQKTSSGEDTEHGSKGEALDKTISKGSKLLDTSTGNFPTDPKLASSKEEIDPAKKVDLTDKKIETSSNNNGGTKGNVVGVHNTENSPEKKEHMEVNEITPIADHKMTPLEQQAYVCSLPEGDLCPMTVNVEENVGISDPGANAYCNSIAAKMGYRGFCVVLMKKDPATAESIYTRTCAYYDLEKSKCSTNFLTAQPQTNLTQVKYQCPNGLTHYIPTSCVNRKKLLVLP